MDLAIYPGNARISDQCCPVPDRYVPTVETRVHDTPISKKFFVQNERRNSKEAIMSKNSKILTHDDLIMIQDHN